MLTTYLFITVSACKQWKWGSFGDVRVPCKSMINQCYNYRHFILQFLQQSFHVQLQSVWGSAFASDPLFQATKPQRLKGSEKLLILCLWEAGLKTGMHFHKSAIISFLSVNRHLKMLAVCVSIYPFDWQFRKLPLVFWRACFFSVAVLGHFFSKETSNTYNGMLDKSCQHLELDSTSYLLAGKLNGSGTDILCSGDGNVLACHPFCGLRAWKISTVAHQGSSSKLGNSCSLH